MGEEIKELKKIATKSVEERGELYTRLGKLENGVVELRGALNRISERLNKVITSAAAVQSKTGLSGKDRVAFYGTVVTAVSVAAYNIIIALINAVHA